jgi:hypothetical protein
LELCAKHKVVPVEVGPDEKVGLAKNVRTATLPLNGMRIEAGLGTCGWYFWSGATLSQAPDFFEPVHVHHLEAVCAPVLPFLLLPPGWRFLLAGVHVDVWFDPELMPLRGA